MQQSQSPDNAPPDTTIADVAIDPAPLHVFWGQQQAVSGTAYNESGSEVSGVQGSWTVEDGAMATVESTGSMSASITGESLGATALYLTVQGVTDSTRLTVDPLLEVTGPTYVGSGSAVATAATQPSGGSYHYTWTITYCENEPNQSWCTIRPSYSGGSGQDDTSASFNMQPTVEWVRFEADLRDSAGGRLIASDSWRVDGPDEAASDDSCHKEICPESGGDEVAVGAR